MKTTIYKGPAIDGGLFYQTTDPRVDHNLVEFINTLGVEINPVSSEEQVSEWETYCRSTSIYHLEPPGLTLKWCLSQDESELGYGGIRFHGGEVEVTLFGKPEALSDMERILLREDRRRRKQHRR